ncbi:MAG TPA: hypothetical protein VFM43_02520 [Gaiellaceae bacterium]|nr:hypothetical protein [Gaiellaceae bacterium]
MQLIRAALTPRLRDEHGQSLVLALLVMTFLAVSLGTVMFFTAGNQRASNYQKAAQLATSLAEAGVNNAVAVLSDPNNAATIEIPPGSTGAVLPGPAPATPQSATYSGNTVKWWGTLNTQQMDQNGIPHVIWTLYGQASVSNPSGVSGSKIVKTMHAQVEVNAPPPDTYDGLVWNSVYSPFGPTTGCDTSIGQGVNVTIPLYVGGNLCMANSSTVNAPTYVGGYLNISNKQAWIGCAKLNANTCQTPAPVTSAHVGGYCAGPSGTQYTPCVSEPMLNGKQDTNIYVQNPTSWVATAPAADFVGIAPPKICWSGSAAEVASGACTGSPPGGWYSFASPGPKFPCGTVQFDNDQIFGPNEGQPNGSLPTVFNLTPATAYTCQTGQGQLSWDPTKRILRVVGTVFFDGSVTATTTGNQPIQYTGAAGNNCTNKGDCQAVIFASGDITINGERLCALINTQGTDCDWSSNWDPNKRLLIFASNGTTGVTVGPSQSAFEGGLYATNTVATGQSAETEGPLVSGTKTVVLGQQFGGTFPHLGIAPWSIDHQPGGFWINPPTNFQYGG